MRDVQRMIARYANCIEQDMVAVPVAQSTEAILVASPAYLERRGVLETPADLLPLAR